MEDGIDSKKGRLQRQNVGKEERRRFGFRHKKSFSIQTLAKKSTETEGRRPRYKEVSTKKQFFSSESTKKRHLRAGDGAMLCECFANGLKISPRCDGGLAHRWRAP